MKKGRQKRGDSNGDAAAPHEDEIRLFLLFCDHVGGQKSAVERLQALRTQGVFLPGTFFEILDLDWPEWNGCQMAQVLEVIRRCWSLVTVGTGCCDVWSRWFEGWRSDIAFEREMKEWAGES